MMLKGFFTVKTWKVWYTYSALSIQLYVEVPLIEFEHVCHKSFKHLQTENCYPFFFAKSLKLSQFG